MWTVNRVRMPIRTGERFVYASFGNSDEWMAWCQNYAIRKSDPDDREPDLLVDNDGKAWVQVGYVMLPAGEVS
jgi:hypothetical protein